jgi:hypothetical protein
MVLAKQESAAAIVREYGVPRWKLYYELKKQRDRGKPAVKSQIPIAARIADPSWHFQGAPTEASYGNRCSPPNQANHPQYHTEP